MSGRLAKDVFAAMVETGKGAKAIVAEKGLNQVTDTGAIERAIDAVLAKEPANIAKYRAGNEKLLGYFVGLVMKATGGQGQSGDAQRTLEEEIIWLTGTSRHREDRERSVAGRSDPEKPGLLRPPHF